MKQRRLRRWVTALPTPSLPEKVRILIAEDVAINRMILLQYLERWGGEWWWTRLLTEKRLFVW